MGAHAHYTNIKEGFFGGVRGMMAGQARDGLLAYYFLSMMIYD